MRICRRRHRRRNSRKQFVIISVNLIVFVFILGTAYSAFSTNLSINASGSIEEHTYTIEDLKSLVVTSGDGLYEDSTEEGRYVYKGGDPDNYILLGDDLFRIIAIESDGTLKVISNESIGQMVFDPGYDTAIDDNILTTPNSSLTNTRWSSNPDDYCYYNGASTEYYGCNAWGSKTTTLDSSGNSVEAMSREIDGDEYNLPSTEAYINMYLNQTYYDGLSDSVQIIIQNHYFNIGVVGSNSIYTLSESVDQEKAYRWQGNVGLINVTDYVKATTNVFCTSVNSYSSNSNCYNSADADNWMYKGTNWWTMSSLSGSVMYNVWYAYLSGNLTNDSAIAFYTVYPVMYLSSSITLQGEGTESSPYAIIS